MITSLDENSTALLNWISRQWEIAAPGIRTDFDISGSPERCRSRAVIQGDSGSLFLLEQFSKEQVSRRRKVASVLDQLNHAGCNLILKYRQSINGSHLPEFQKLFYGITPFVKGEPIKRPEYLESADIGEQFASFIFGLEKAAAPLDLDAEEDPFNLKTYIYDLFIRMERFNPDIVAMYEPVLKFLEKTFMDAHDHLPIGFCHGDLHPLNVIWKNNRMTAVIDWEFFGIKPRLYDAANLVGCAGIENPKGLAGKMVSQLLSKLTSTYSNTEYGWELFPEYVLALRFAWLSEWLRNKDAEMIELEKTYMQILMQNMDVLKKGWKLDALTA